MRTTVACGFQLGHKVGMGVDFTGEEAARNFLTVTISEINFRKVLFEFETLHDV